MIAFTLALVLGQFVAPGLRGSVCHDELGEGNLCGWGYVQTPSVAVPAPVALVDALAPGDKAGAWWALRGDGTMVAGSAFTMVPTGSPTNSTENAWPVRSYTGAQNDQAPSNAPFPASDFSVCVHNRSNTLPGTEIMGFGTGGSSATFTVLPFELQPVGSLISYVSNGTQASPTISGGSLTVLTWHVLCFTFLRVADTTSVGTLYVDGVAVGSSSGMRLPQAQSSVWSTNGVAGAGIASARSMRGAFVTYKLLSASDVARIYAATAP